jgi:hypothetical protein
MHDNLDNRWIIRVKMVKMEEEFEHPSSVLPKHRPILLLSKPSDMSSQGWRYYYIIALQVHKIKKFSAQARVYWYIHPAILYHWQETVHLLKKPNKNNLMRRNNERTPNKSMTHSQRNDNSLSLRFQFPWTHKAHFPAPTPVEWAGT